MAQIIGAFRIGRDAELRYLTNGDAVCNLALAADYGRKDESGKRPTQWVEASIFGKRAEALAPYLLKGQQVYAVMGDPHIQTYEGKNGQGHKLVAHVLEIELVGGRPQGEAAPRQQARAPQPQSRPAPARQQPGNSPATARPSSGFDDMDDSVPF